MTTKEPDVQQVEIELQMYGEKAATIMQQIPKKLNNFVSGMLCTLEGFNVCSIGFEDKQISKMAAVSSSLYAMSTSVLEAFSAENNPDVNVVTISSKNMDILAKKITLSNGKSLVLILASRGAAIGIQLYAAQFVEENLKNAI